MYILITLQKMSFLRRSIIKKPESEIISTFFKNRALLCTQYRLITDVNFANNSNDTKSE